MYKYEEQINAQMNKYNQLWQTRYIEFCDMGIDSQKVLDTLYESFRRELDGNTQRALDRYYIYDATGVHKRENLFDLPTLQMDCANTEALPNSSGVYFLGMIGTNPDGRNYYLVKIGSSQNIRLRVRQYATYNPMIYIGGYYVIKGYDAAETTCHQYLRERAYAIAQNSTEWFYVTEEVYYELCETFGQYHTFGAIAEGRD